MSLYRRPGRFATRTLVIAAAGAVVVGLIAGFALGRTTASSPTLAEKVADLREQLVPATSGLELTATEYGQAVRGGRVIAPTEYGAAALGRRARARDARRRARRPRRARPRGGRGARRRGRRVDAGVRQRVDPREVRRRAEAAMQTLRATPSAPEPSLRMRMTFSMVWADGPDLDARARRRPRRRGRRLRRGRRQPAAGRAGGDGDDDAGRRPRPPRRRPAGGRPPDPRAELRPARVRGAPGGRQGRRAVQTRDRLGRRRRRLARRRDRRGRRAGPRRRADRPRRRRRPPGPGSAATRPALVAGPAQRRPRRRRDPRRARRGRPGATPPLPPPRRRLRAPDPAPRRRDRALLGAGPAASAAW